MVGEKTEQRRFVLKLPELLVFTRKWVMNATRLSLLQPYKGSVEPTKAVPDCFLPSAQISGQMKVFCCFA